jgi:hypothetical protein
MLDSLRGQIGIGFSLSSLSAVRCRFGRGCGSASLGFWFLGSRGASWDGLVRSNLLPQFLKQRHRSWPMSAIVIVGIGVDFYTFGRDLTAGFHPDLQFTAAANDGFVSHSSVLLDAPETWHLEDCNAREEAGKVKCLKRRGAEDEEKCRRIQRTGVQASECTVRRSLSLGICAGRGIIRAAVTVRHHGWA